MKSNLIIGVLAVAVIGIIGAMSMQVFPENSPVTETTGHSISATIYKSPSCGCCEQYATYLDNKGYGIYIEGVADMQSVKERFDVPYELESCHTMEIDGYIVEGHVPEEAVHKLLTEKPNIKGVGMAGMPSGSPGMPGPKRSDFVIYEITHDGTRGEVFMTI